MKQESLEKQEQLYYRIMKICQEAIDLWGTQSQEDMCIEECSELIHAIFKHRRGRNTPEDILEEIVDVQIMLIQMRVSIDDEQKFTELFNKKLDRLKSRINIAHAK